MVTYRKVSTVKGSCMECMNERINYRDSDGQAFCSVNCVKAWHGDIEEHYLAKFDKETWV